MKMGRISCNNLPDETLLGETFAKLLVERKFFTKPKISHFHATNKFVRRKVSPKKNFYFCYHYWSMDYNASN